MVWLILSRVKEYLTCLAMTSLQIFKKFPACEGCTTTEDFVLRLLGKLQRSDRSGVYKEACFPRILIINSFRSQLKASFL